MIASLSLIHCLKCRNKNNILTKTIILVIVMVLISVRLLWIETHTSIRRRRNERIVPDFIPDANSASLPTLILTCIGEEAFDKYQPYIWYSLTQARMTNPNVSIVVILSRTAYRKSIRQRLSALKITSIFHDDLIGTNSLLQDFRKVFFVKGLMVPGGNKHFVQFAVERLLSVYAYMNYTGVSNVFHIENDNMLYIDLPRLSERMKICGVRFAFPRAAINQAVTSFIYAETSQAIEHFVRWCVNVFKLGPDMAAKYLNTTWINDMTLGAHYLRLYVSPNTAGVFELPTRFHAKSENCCLCYLSRDSREQIIFDACVIGQYFGGTFSRPNQTHWEENRLFDPRGTVLRWHQDSRDKLKRPFIRDIRIVNIHVHSKQLEQFSSFDFKQQINLKNE